jgi:hypothetical protein
MEIADASSFGRRVFFGELEARFAGKRYEQRESAVVTSCHRQTGHAAARIALRRLALCVGVLVANFVATMSPAGAQAGSQALAYPLTVYVQASDARFDSYSYSKNNVFPDHASEDLEEFFYIPHPRSKEREREFSAWRRQFRVIISAATFAESAQEKIALVKKDFDRANSASECWSVDYDRERRITVTVIGSTSERFIRAEYEAVSRQFFVSSTNFSCKYAGGATP